MTDVNATNNPIVVDRAAGETDGGTTIRYEKARSDEFWENLSGGMWSQVTNSDLIRRVGTTTAETKGTFALGGVLVPPRLKPGETYEVGIFEEGHGPLTPGLSTCVETLPRPISMRSYNNTASKHRIRE